MSLGQFEVLYRDLRNELLVERKAIEAIQRKPLAEVLQSPAVRANIRVDEPVQFPGRHAHHRGAARDDAPDERGQAIPDAVLPERERQKPQYRGAHHSATRPQSASHRDPGNSRLAARSDSAAAVRL